MKTPKTLLLLPLVPALAFGIVEIASRIRAPTTVGNHAPDRTPEQDRCIECAAPA